MSDAELLAVLFSLNLVPEGASLQLQKRELHVETIQLSLAHQKPEVAWSCTEKAFDTWRRAERNAPRVLEL
eukprot:CAMPEP_0116822526 /NCGR_PEP_ID=MMETSP0418-20121206/320_1 /TAXON_ID=1158023 /ORGANISM="Astrosyne radiata, Strain 13vi08-1A" /LENGTH=70 /DNA_ID=CAMNT_0004450655 /DNA_START=330 /DNA_END=542 /DNA_ORIENTATION=+